MRKFLLSRSLRAVVFKQLNCWWYIDTTVMPADLGTTILSVSEKACMLGDMSTPPFMNNLLDGCRYFFASGQPLAFDAGGFDAFGDASGDLLEHGVLLLSFGPVPF